MKKILAVFSVLVMMSFMAAVAGAAEVKIGVMAPITGAWAAEGQDMVDIVKLLAEEVNANKLAGPHTIVIEVGDDAGTPKNAALAAQRLISGDVVAVIGTYGSAVTEASQDIYADEGVLQIATGSTSIRLSEKNLPLFFRTCPRDDDQGRVLSENVKALGFKKVAIVHDNSSYAKGLADECLNLLGKDGLEIVFNDAITPGDRDYTATLTKIKTTNPDVIVFTGYYPEAGMILRQKTDMKWDVPMIGGDATNNLALLDVAGKSAVGYYFVSPQGPSDMTGEEAKKFIADFSAKYGHVPASVWCVMAGDAFRVLVEAIKNTEDPTAENLAAYLHNDLKDFPGFTGSIAFDAKGDRVGDVYRLYQVTDDGKFGLLK